MRLIKGIAASVAATLLTGAAGAADLTAIIPSGPDGEALAGAAKRFEEATGKSVEIVAAPYDNVLDKVVSACTAKTGAYDVVLIDDPWFPLMSGGNCLEPLTDHFKAAGVSGPDADFVPNTLKLCQEPYGEGAFYCLPYTGNAQLFFYNPAMLAEAGFTKPLETWDDVLAGATAVTEAGKGRTFGYVLRGIQGHPIADGFLPIFWSFGGQIFDKDNKAAVNSPEGVKALEFYLKLRDVSPPGISGFDSEELQNYMTTRKAAAAVFWPIFISRFEDPNASNVVGEVKYSAMPSETVTGKSMIGNWLVGISSESKNKDLAYEFISFASSAEQMKIAAEHGNSPVRISTFEDKELVADPRFRHFPVLLEALNNSEARPRQPRWPEIVQALGTELSAAMTDAKTPQQAMDDANAAIDAIVAR